MPPAASSHALLLRSVKSGESDLILSLATRRFGKLSCVAKNALGSRRRFGACLQPFCVFEAMLRPKSGGLGFLESTLPIKSYPPMLESLERMNAGYRLLELAEQLQEPGAVHAEFYDALEAGLGMLAWAEDPGSAALRAEAQMLSLSGWEPRLDACVQCRREAPFSSPRFSLSEGGLLCQDCKPQGSWIRLAAGGGSALSRLFLGQEGSVAEAKQPLRRFVEHQLGKALKTEAFEAKALRPTAFEAKL
jgi:DNA repair protein RecO (recombination protein O)